MTGTLLALAAAGLSALAGLEFRRLILRVAIAEGRWKVSAMMAAAAVLALAAFAAGTGVVMGVLAGVTLAIAFVYFALLALASQSTQQPAVAVGEPLLEFTATDADGQPFALSSLAGHPVLIKFFRGHW